VVNGVSLTVNRITDIGSGTDLVCQFSINLIPHTIAVTTLKHLQVGARSTWKST
jgi:riboflavin synthase